MLADLVLDLAGQRQFAAQVRRPQDPVALRKDPHELAVGVHLDELQDGGPIVVRHPVIGLDLAPGRDVRIEGLGTLDLVHVGRVPGLTPRIAVSY